jgi:Metallo-beta-lactamase superfamily
MQDLHKIDKDLFPLLPDTPKSVFHLEQELEKNSDNYVVGRQRMVHNVEPVVSLLSEKYIPAYTPVVDLTSVQELIDEIADSGNIEGYTDEFVVPLGTGSAVPCRYRNVSSTYVHHSTGGVLFDAGEGTLGQLEKRFGQELRDRLRALKLVFISHIHGDHVLGLANVVFAWIAATNDTSDKLIIVATGAVFEWLRHLAYFENTLDDFLTRLVLVNTVCLKQGESDDQDKDVE